MTAGRERIEKRRSSARTPKRKRGTSRSLMRS